MLCDLTQHDHCENVGITVRPRRYTNCIQAFLEAYRKIEDWTSHDQLREDLIESMAINWEIILGKLWRGQILGGSPKGLARERKKHIFLMEAALWRHRVCAQHTQPPKHYGVRSTRAMGSVDMPTLLEFLLSFYENAHLMIFAWGLFDMQMFSHHLHPWIFL